MKKNRQIKYRPNAHFDFAQFDIARKVILSEVEV